MGRLRRWFIAGIAAILPIGFTIFVFWFLISRLGNIFQPVLGRFPWLKEWPGWLLTFFGFILLLVVILGVGALASGLIGGWFLGWLDRLLRQLPFVKGVYTSTRQLTDAIFVKKSSLRRTVIAQYPRPGLLAVGFVTSDDRIELVDGRKAVFVYFPTTPNPTSGWLALIPEGDITETELSTDEGLRLVVSGGVVKPDSFDGLVQQARISTD